MSELRYDPLQDQWVIVAPERQSRPDEFAFQPTDPAAATICPFCPGSERLTPPEITAVRPDGTPADTPGWAARVVPNRFPALSPTPATLDRMAEGLYDRMNGIGAHEVVIETTGHYIGLGETTVEHLSSVLKIYRDRMKDLMNDFRLRYILIFKNHQAAAGATIAHSHSQIIATPIVPAAVQRELETSHHHFVTKERCLLCDILEQELADGSRIIYDDGAYIAFAPYASRFPFEVTIAPRNHLHQFALLPTDDLVPLAGCMKELLLRYKNLLNAPPYNFMIHTAPNPNGAVTASNGHLLYPYEYHWHIELFPRLNRVAGFEWGSGFYINTTPPEAAVKYLREVSIES